MRASTLLYFATAFSAIAFADDDCDENEDNDTCTSSVSSTGSELPTRLSRVTLTTTDVGVLTTTDIGNSVFTTSLPSSIRTYTTETPVDTTLVPVLTPSTVLSNTVVETNTLTDADGNTITSTSMPSSTASMDGDDNDDDNNDDDDDNTSSGAAGASSTAGAAAIYAPGVMGGALLGLAALL